MFWPDNWRHTLCMSNESWRSYPLITWKNKGNSVTLKIWCLIWKRFIKEYTKDSPLWHYHYSSTRIATNKNLDNSDYIYQFSNMLTIVIDHCFPQLYLWHCRYSSTRIATNKNLDNSDCMYQFSNMLTLGVDHCFPQLYDSLNTSTSHESSMEVSKHQLFRPHMNMESRKLYLFFRGEGIG